MIKIIENLAVKGLIELFMEFQGNGQKMYSKALSLIKRKMVTFVLCMYIAVHSLLFIFMDQLDTQQNNVKIW